MAHIELAPEIMEDFECILAHLAEYEVANAAARIAEIVGAIDILATHPLIGRPGNANKRELVIGEQTHGYVALYQYVQELDTVFVLAIRSQREAGYRA